jgi:hypothetical protein
MATGLALSAATTATLSVISGVAVSLAVTTIDCTVCVNASVAVGKGVVIEVDEVPLPPPLQALIASAMAVIRALMSNLFMCMAPSAVAY